MKQLLALVSLLFGFAAAAATPAVDMSSRHVYILEGGVDQVWGTYFFLAENPHKQPTEASFTVMLPQETTDWRVQEGIDPENIQLGPNGGLVAKQRFAAGSTLVRISFMAKGKLGSVPLTLTTPIQIDDLRFLAPKGGLQLSGSGFVPQDDVQMGHGLFSGLNMTEVAAGTTVNVSVTGIPEGRLRYWIIGSSLIAVLLLTSLLLALTTKPKLDDAPVL